jgi:hypothetical protein
MATRRKPYAITLFNTARDRPGPLVASSNPAGAKILFILRGFLHHFQAPSNQSAKRAPIRYPHESVPYAPSVNGLPPYRSSPPTYHAVVQR